jgi:superfamily II DNA helicase RecQ
VKVVAATATCNNTILEDLTTLMNWKFDKVIWSSIDQREIYMRFELVTVEEKKKTDENHYERFLDKASKHENSGVYKLC